MTPTITAPEITAPEITAMKDAARSQRMETWRLTIEQELQTLITQAADMRKTINEAQTSVKKKYYTKKFKKISEQVVQLLAIQSQLPPREQPDSTTTTPSVIDESAGTHE